MRHPMSNRTAAARALVPAMLACVCLLPGHASQIPPSAREVASLPLSPVDGGEAIRLRDLQGGWIALHFLLPVECSYCLMHTLDYALKADTVPEVRHVFVKPNDAKSARKWQDTLMAAPDASDAPSVPPLIVRDEAGRVARGLLLRHGYKYRGATMNYPAFVLLDPEGEEVFRHVGEQTMDRFGFEQFAGLMERFRRPFDLDAMNLPESGFLILEGHDPVAYFTMDEAVQGDPEIADTYHGIVIWFATEEHRARFQDDPTRYLPAYGGWCATNVARGHKRRVDPTHFRIHDGRLFLFNRGVLTDARQTWDADAAGHVAAADARWPGIARDAAAGEE